MVRARRFLDRGGQATVEYVLLLGIIVGFFLIVARGLKQLDLAKVVSAPLTGDFKYAYKYGHPKARGWDDGGPKMHPRAPYDEDPTNFRIFISPESR